MQPRTEEFSLLLEDQVCRCGWDKRCCSLDRATEIVNYRFITSQLCLRTFVYFYSIYFSKKKSQYLDRQIPYMYSVQNKPLKAIFYFIANDFKGETAAASLLLRYFPNHDSGLSKR